MPMGSRTSIARQHRRNAISRSELFRTARGTIASRARCASGFGGSHRDVSLCDKSREKLPEMMTVGIQVHRLISRASRAAHREPLRGIVGELVEIIGVSVERIVRGEQAFLPVSRDRAAVGA